MNKTQIHQALKLARSKQKELKDWIVTHATNPEVATAAKDVRFWEGEEMRLTKIDGETYPTLQEVEGATQKEVMEWYRTIPPAQTVEELRTRARMGERIQELPHLTKNK